MLLCVVRCLWFVAVGRLVVCVACCVYYDMVCRMSRVARCVPFVVCCLLFDVC